MSPVETGWFLPHGRPWILGRRRTLHPLYHPRLLFRADGVIKDGQLDQVLGKVPEMAPHRTFRDQRSPMAADPLHVSDEVQVVLAA